MKKLISAILAILCMAIPGGFASAADFSDVSRDNTGDSKLGAITALADSGVLTGYPDGSFRPYNSITRAEFAAVMCRALGDEGTAKSLSGGSVFTDVSGGHWASGYIAYGYITGMINGMGDGTFDPNGNITYEQAVKMVVASLGGEQAAIGRGGYPNGYLAVGRELGLDYNANIRVGYPANRGDVAQIVYNGGFVGPTAVGGITIIDDANPAGGGITAGDAASPAADGITVGGAAGAGASGSVGGGIKVGDTLSTVESGRTAFRTIDTNGGQWRLYNKYDGFLAVYFSNGSVGYAYTTDISGAADGVVLTDKNDGGRKYAVSIGTLPSDTAGTTEQLIFEITNAFRALHGKKALIWNDRLAAAARSHSADMVSRAFFSHINPDGKNPGDRITAAGYSWASYAENINGGYGNAVSAMDGWINSSGHRNNILTSTCDEIGVGWALGTPAYGTQKFGLERNGQIYEYEEPSNPAPATPQENINESASPQADPTGTIEITGVSPASAQAGVETAFSVTVKYTSQNTRGCVIYAGANTEAADSYSLYDEYVLPGESGTYTFSFKCTPEKWDEYDFGIYVNISENPHPDSWNPFASDVYTIPLTSGDEPAAGGAKFE
jgi:hypothetical protein